MEKPANTPTHFTITSDLQEIYSFVWKSVFLSLECVVVDKPILTDSEEEDKNSIEIKVQGIEPDSKKAFQILKVCTEEAFSVGALHCCFKNPEAHMFFNFL